MAGVVGNRRIGEDRLSLDIDGRAVPLLVRRNPRARRLIVRMDRSGEGVVVTVPATFGIEDGVALARRKTGWIAARLAALPPRIPFADGAMVPVLGTDLRIRHHPGGHPPVRRVDDEIVVSGHPEHLARRLADWLKGEARREIARRAEAKAAQLERPLGRVTVRDTRSRWGSCSASGNLSFCWRLILAPETVLDYVVAHEVAHLAVRDHGPRFWRTVATLVDDAATARAWLRRHGPALYRYG
jgi:predicted metal-dependent hydrolase